MDFSFFKQTSESEVKFLWFLHSIGGETSLNLEQLSKTLYIDIQQLRRATNKLRDKGIITKVQTKIGRGGTNTYRLAGK